MTSQVSSKQQFASLRGDDLLFKERREDELVERLQKKLGRTRGGIHKRLAKL